MYDNLLMGPIYIGHRHSYREYSHAAPTANDLNNNT